MEDTLILRDHYFPIEGKAKKPSLMTNEDWLKLDRKAISTIRQCLAKNVYSIVPREKTTKYLWHKLHDLYEKSMTSNKVFLMKKLYNLNMKEGVLVVEHLNEFNILTN
jgi:hypothetical protein